MKVLRRVIVVTCLLLVSMLVFENLLTKKLNDIYDDSLGHEYAVDLSQYRFNTSLDRNNLMLLGSSELSSPVEQNPRDFFPIKTFDAKPTVVGVAYVQDLQHSINVGSYHGNLSDKKMVYVLSLQWFFDKSGIDNDSFVPHFSPIRYYNFMNNKRLSASTKQKTSKRVMGLLKNKARFSPEYLYAWMHVNNDWYRQVTRVAFEPYYWTRIHILSIRDKIAIYNKLNKIEKINFTTKDIQWDKEFEKATEQGKKACTNNQYYLNDEYYNQYIAANIEKIKGAYSDTDLINSKEVSDYKNFLEVCREQKAQPLIVIMPVNGRMYDHMGLTKEKRADFYKYAENMAKSYGFKVLNYPDREYEPYFMIDTMHLGWRGWLQIDKDIVEHFNK